MTEGRADFTQRMPACFPAREAVIQLRTKRDKLGSFDPTKYTVIFPADWGKKQFLDYVRAVHPNETAKIITWGNDTTAKGEPRIWLANPRAFSNFKKGVMK